MRANPWVKGFFAMRAPRHLALLPLLLTPAVCTANAGIPVGTYSFIWSVLLFVPIVLVEGWILRSDLRLSYGRALGTTMPSNILSTLAGAVVPLLTVPFATTESAASSAITLALFVPLFYLSRAIETAYSGWSLNSIEKTAIRRAVNRANLVTYAMLAIFVVVRFLKSWMVHGYIFW